MLTRQVRKFVDNFDRAQAFTTTPGMNGWTIKDTSAAGTPTYLCVTGGGAKLTMVNTNEAEILTLYHNDVLAFDVRAIQHVWWILKVADMDANTTLTFGVASAQNDTDDSVATNAWFRVQGSTSTSAVLVETDDATNDNDDKATGETLGSTYKKFLLDFTRGLADVRPYIDGQPVNLAAPLDMSRLAAGLCVQPWLQLQKAASTGIASVTARQFGIQYELAM